jgi:glycosyltransferase involved in cell wall biosynthesis
MKVSVIIPTYKRARTLRDTITSLQDQTLPGEDYEIIVADNNSTDDTPEVVKELARSSPVKIVYLKETKQGVHYARNTSAEVAESEILYYTDDDVIADRDMLKQIIRPFTDSEASMVGSVGGKVLPRWEAEPPEWVTKHFGGGWLSLLDEGDTVKVLERPHIWSCHMAIRKQTLKEFGGFSPENTEGIWVGDGETGLLRKLLKAGLRLVYTPSSVVWHVIPPSRLTQKYMNLRMSNQGAADAYSYYKEHRFSSLRLFIRSLGEFMAFTAMKLGAGVERTLGLDRWHMTRAKSYYWLSRSKYNRDLIYNDDLRRFVLKDNWFE